MLLKEWNWDEALMVQKRSGKREGIRENQEVTARNMKAKGLDLHLIADVTGLTFDEVLNA